jgi:hypothetical protein
VATAEAGQSEYSGEQQQQPEVLHHSGPVAAPISGCTDKQTEAIGADPEVSFGDQQEQRAGVAPADKGGEQLPGGQRPQQPGR